MSTCGTHLRCLLLSGGTEARARAGGSCAVRAVGPVGGSDVLSRGLWDGSNSLTSISISARYKGIRRQSKSV